MMAQLIPYDGFAGTNGHEQMMEGYQRAGKWTRMNALPRTRIPEKAGKAGCAAPKPGNDDHLFELIYPAGVACR